jgi:hypothetical protein
MREESQERRQDNGNRKRSMTPRAVRRRVSRSNSRSRSPYRREDGRGRDGIRSPYGGGKGGRRRDGGARRDRAPERKSGRSFKERSLSPYSKRLALTQALGR